METIQTRDSRATSLSELLRSANPDRTSDPAFRSVNSVRRKFEDLRTARPGYPTKVTRGGKATREVTEAFFNDPEQMHGLARQLRTEPALLSLSFTQQQSEQAYVDLDVQDEEVAASAFEGAVAQRLAAYRERDPKLRRQKIAQARRGRGSISCETCQFDFEGTYGELGEGYTHVHHIVPLYISGPVMTDLDDLVLVCANCHAMIHRHKKWKTPDELATILSEQL